MSILSTSPTSTRYFDMEIAAALGSFEAAVILQQLHYWTQKEGIGVIIDQAKYIYNTFEEWVKKQFTFLSVWKFRKGMDILRSLSIVKVIRYRSKEWNQTNYYNLNYEQLQNWARAQSIEILEMCNSTPQNEENQTLKVRNNEVSLYGTKITTKERTTKQSDRLNNELNSIAAASPKTALKKEKSLQERLEYSKQLTASPGTKKAQSKQIETENQEEINVLGVDYIVNKKWKELIPELDSAGISTNKTLKDLLKLYPAEQVREAIAIFRSRKREQHIPNPSGYFVAALKGNWGSKQIVESPEFTEEIDKAAVFRHWYDLARELGYCNSQEIRDGEQWVCVSGGWERWSDAVARGYSLEYLKKIMKRNKGQ